MCLHKVRVKSLSPWKHIHKQHVSRSYYLPALVKKEKKSQLDEDKHMLFVSSKQHLTNAGLKEQCVVFWVIY